MTVFLLKLLTQCVGFVGRPPSSQLQHVKTDLLISPPALLLSTLPPPCPFLVFPVSNSTVVCTVTELKNWGVVLVSFFLNLFRPINKPFWMYLQNISSIHPLLYILIIASLLVQISIISHKDYWSSLTDLFASTVAPCDLFSKLKSKQSL